MSLWKNSIERSSRGLHRKEDNRNIEFNIPSELYNIDAGQFVLFVSKDGFDQNTAQKINDLFFYLRSLDINDVKMNVITTDNDEYLIGNIACRSLKETGDTYKVAIGSWNTIAGLIAYYSGMSVDEVVKKFSSSAENSRLSINSSNLPNVVSINPDDCPTTEQHYVPDCSLCPYMGESGFGGMEAKVEEKNKPSLLELENKISAVLADCERYGYDVDTIGLKDKVRDAWEHPIEYELKLDIQEKKWLSTNGPERIISVCDIYIEGNGEKHIINLRPAEKALYLTNILRGGFPLANMSMDVIKDMSSIFQQIPGHQTKEDGLVYKNQSISGIGVMKKRIRDAFASAINFGPDVEDLAMEGFRGKEVSIRKATDKHREQIKKYFGL